MAQQTALLSPIDVASLLGDSRQQHVEITEHLPAKLRTDYMRESEFFKAIILRGPSSDQMRKCNPKSLMAAFVNSASLGLTLNPIKKHCTIIPRWNKEVGEFEAQNLIMYQGLTFLATQAGVRDIISEVVYSADKFDMERTEKGDTYSHKINVTTPRGVNGNDFLGVYVAAKMPGSDFPKVEWIPKEDIYLMREKSESYLDKNNKPKANSPWVMWFDEMAKKSGIKRAQKRWEELVEANESWNVFKSAVDLDNRQESRPIEGESYEVVSEEQIEAIQKAMLDAEMKKQSIILDAYKVDEISKLPAAKFEEILKRIKDFGKAKQEKKSKTGGTKKDDKTEDKK